LFLNVKSKFPGWRRRASHLRDVMIHMRWLVAPKKTHVNPSISDLLRGEKKEVKKVNTVDVLSVQEWIQNF
jgi:hypothetical protein